MVADGNLLTVMALAAQHTRSFLFGHNCDEETPLFVSGGTSGKNETLRDNATSIMEAVSMQTGPDARTSARAMRGRPRAMQREGHQNLTAKKLGFYAQTLQTDSAANPLRLPRFQPGKGEEG